MKKAAARSGYSVPANVQRELLSQRLVASDALSLLVLSLGLCLLFWKALDAGEFWWTDESRHAMNGVFFLDLWRDMPWRAPYQYALQYFAQYPALALNWYPPFFPLVESVFFAVFGISEFAGRLTVLAFAFVGTAAWYAWAREALGRLKAAVEPVRAAGDPVDRDTLNPSPVPKAGT